MIRWCAYCQTFQGEREPFDDYSVTHTICHACVASSAHLREDTETRIEPVRTLFRKLTDHPRANSPAALLAEGTRLGIAPMDLLLGLLQPALYEVGERWARSEASVADEHELTRMCSVIVALLLEGRPELVALRQAERPDVLLACVEGNMHALGLQIVEFFLLTRGLSVHTVLPGVPSDELVALSRARAPSVVGLSVALPDQLAAAIDVATRIRALSGARKPSVVVGGFSIRGMSVLPAGAPLRACPDFRVIPEILASAARARGVP